MSHFIMFALGCTLTYLVTVLSSSIRASTILESAARTFAFLIITGYETNAEQAELLIANNRMSESEASDFRKKSNKSFEEYVNKKIDFVNKNIPPAHRNIIKFRNFKELKVFVVSTALKHKRRK